MQKEQISKENILRIHKKYTDSNLRIKDILKEESISFSTYRKYLMLFLPEKMTYLKSLYSKDYINKIYEIDYIINSMSLKRIENKYKLLKDSLPILFKLYKLPLKNKIREVEDDYFNNIDSELKAYILGFIYADGSISTNGNCLYISVSYIDHYIIKLMQKSFCKSSQIDLIKPYRIGKAKIGISIYSDQIKQDLSKYGIVPRKTYLDTKLPNINIELIRHFIRGYFDGDGTSSITVNKQKNTGNAKGTNFKVAFTCYTDGILKDIQCELRRNGIVSKLKHYKNNFKRYYYSLVISLADTQKMYHYLYDNCNYSLLRKRDKFYLDMLTPRELLFVKEQEPRNA